MRTFNQFKRDQASKPKLQFSLEDLLPKKPGFSLIVGEPGKGKTNLMLNIAAGIASGKDPVPGLKVNKSKVGYVLFENPGLTAKLDKIEALYGSEEGIPGFYLEEENPSNIFSLKKKLIESFTGLDLGILDPFNRIFAGNVSNPPDMAKNVAVVEEISRESGAHILVVHHTRKKGNDPRYKYVAQDLNDIKGANELQAGSVTIMMLRDEYQSDLWDWGYGKGFPKKRGDDYLVIEFERAQATDKKPSAMGLFFDRPTLSFKRSEGMISTARPSAAKSNGVHAGEPD